LPISDATLRDEIDALDRIGTVAHDVAEADDAVDASRIEVGKHRLERREVRVDVADQGRPHSNLRGSGGC
jgi:hypothetical protein